MSIEVGNRVAYSARFLRSTGQHTGEAPHARGTVTEVMDLGAGSKLATITWDREGIPARVNVGNLVQVGRIGIEAALADSVTTGRA